MDPYDKYKTAYALELEGVNIGYFEYDNGKCSLV